MAKIIPGGSGIMETRLCEKHFELFKSECKKWQERLGLISWDIEYAFTPIDDTYGDCTSSFTSRSALIRLSTDLLAADGLVWDSAAIDANIKRTALHEMLELLLSPVIFYAQDRCFCQTDFDQESHIVIRTLERVLGEL